MASTQKKSSGGKRAGTSSGKRNPSASSRKGSTGRGKAAAAQPKPIRREVGGIVLLVLALCVLVTYFNVDAILLTFLANVLKGCMGYGYWLAAPALLYAGIVLVGHKGRPVKLRTTCTLLLPVLGVVLGFCILAGGALLLYLRRILHPISVLSGAAKAMSEGNFSVRAPEGKATCPEIAELSASFNTMAEKLSQLEESRREFVANVSHELRSPITAISGYVEGMRDGTIGQEDYPQYLTIVSDETTRLKNLIGDLLKLSRLEKADAALNKTNFDICELLSRVLLHRTGDLEAKKMDVECDFAPEPCMVNADESRIEQVAVNLLDNAIKFTPDGGVIRMSVRVNQGICTVIVQDNGVGISPEDRPHVFERFYTADKAHTSGKGTGLGLSICQRIMEMHGQKITLMDTGDEAGAAFAFTLDCAK